MLEGGATFEKARFLGHLEDLLEMGRLPRVGHVEHAVGALLVDALAHGGEVGCRVHEPAISLLDDEGERIAIAGGVPAEC